MPPSSSDRPSFPGHAEKSLKGTWKLPPLILHPFAGERSADRLVEGSRASLMLNGLLPHSGSNDDLTRLVLAGRYQEIKMLYFLGKDLFRWIEQCLDFATRIPELSHLGYREQSFAAMLVETPPEAVLKKLQAWGVGDHKAIFSRAIGLNALMAEPPVAQSLSPLFLQSYHRFSDHLYICYQHLVAFTPVTAANFSFEIYASEEYSKMLEEQWNAGEKP